MSKKNNRAILFIFWDQRTRDTDSGTKEREESGEERERRDARRRAATLPTQSSRTSLLHDDRRKTTVGPWREAMCAHVWVCVCGCERARVYLSRKLEWLEESEPLELHR